MSIKLMTAIWDNQDPALSGTKLNILLCLADHANDAGVCWPSIDRLAARARVHRTNVIKAVRDLEALGYLEVLREEGLCNRYVVHTSSAGATGSDGETSSAGATPTSSAGATPTSSAGATPPVALALPEPSENHQSEPSSEPSSSSSSPPPPAAPAAGIDQDVFEELRDFGVGEPSRTELSRNGHTIGTVRAWIDYLATQPDLRNPRAYLVARLRAHDSPPEPPELDDDSYEALKRKYVPDAWADIIQY